MAKKKEKQDKKINNHKNPKSRIVKEFIESKFKEIKKEKEEIEEQEEQIKDNEEFFDFDTGRRTAPILPEANNPLPALEETAQEARTSENTATDTSLYSDYSSSASYTKDTGYDNPEQKVEIIRPAGMDDERIRGMLPRQNTWQTEQNAWAQQDVWNMERHEERKYEAIDKKAKEETEKLKIDRRRRLRF